LTRILDILLAALALCLLSPLLAALALRLWAVEGRPLLHGDPRVGRGGRVFHLYKFRTLRAGVGGGTVAPEDDPRITRAGLWLRRWRLDELPELVNVLRGDLALVGPRPMPPAHADALAPAARALLLSVRPGVTDPAALHFLAEDAVLAGVADAESVYLRRFLPAKTRMQLDYLRRRNVCSDLRVLGRTAAVLWSPGARRASAVAMRELLRGPEIPG